MNSRGQIWAMLPPYLLLIMIRVAWGFVYINDRRENPLSMCTYLVIDMLDTLEL